MHIEPISSRVATVFPNAIADFEWSRMPTRPTKPKKAKAHRYSPKQQGLAITSRIRRRSRFCGERLCRSRMEFGGVGVRSLLIEQRRRHDVRRSALVALVWILLRYGCHAVVPDLATACDTGLHD